MPDLLQCDPGRHGFALNSPWNHGIDQGSHIPVVSFAGLVVKTSREGVASRAPFRGARALLLPRDSQWAGTALQPLVGVPGGAGSGELLKSGQGADNLGASITKFGV
jgi:hypothetical protein